MTTDGQTETTNNNHKQTNKQTDTKQTTNNQQTNKQTTNNDHNQTTQHGPHTEQQCTALRPRSTSDVAAEPTTAQGPVIPHSCCRRLCG